MLPETADIVIVGAGAIGCSTAYHLARRGARDVVVLEKGAIGSGSTSKAAGGLRAQFGTDAEIAFSLESLEFIRHARETLGRDAEFRQIGYLSLVVDEADLAAFRERVAFQQSRGVDVRILTPEDTRELVPALDVHDVLAGIYGPTDGYAGPYEVTMGYVARAREGGVRFCEDTTVTGIRRGGDRVTGVETDQGAIAAPIVVNAAGPAAARIGRLVGIDLPVHPRRRHIFVTEDFPEIPGPIPLTTDRGSGFYFRKEMEKVLMSPGDVEDIHSDSDVPVDWSRLEEAVDKAVKRVPILAQARIANAWAGLRPLTPDEHAIIGAIPEVPGYYVSVGFCGHGFQHSPAAGKHLAELILDGRSSVDLSTFDPGRFKDSSGRGDTAGVSGPD